MARHVLGVRLKAASFLLLPATLLTLALSKSDYVVSAQTRPQSFDKIVRAKHKHFIEYQQDFDHFAKSGIGTDEYQYAMDLAKVAGETEQNLSAVNTLLEIYGDLSCEEDRANVRPVIERDLGYYSKMIDLSVEEANLTISQTHMPGVASEGTRMRDDLREVKTIFDSIKLR
jgi:hypothetical protein